MKNGISLDNGGSIQIYEMNIPLYTASDCQSTGRKIDFDLGKNHKNELLTKHCLDGMIFTSYSSPFEAHMNKALSAYIEEHNAANDGIRLGQRFCNDFIRYSWPTLFYSENQQRSIAIIESWLADLCYMETLPPKIDWSAM